MKGLGGRIMMPSASTRAASVYGRSSWASDAEPEHVLNMDTCVSGIAFHPKKERLLAAAGANGEIFVWDLALATDNLVADSGLKTFGGHSEPITALRWITATPNSRTFLILTAGLDGRLIMWANNASKTTPNRSTVTPSKQMTIVQTTTSVLKNSWSDGLISASVMGVTSVNTSVSSCLFGTDTGGIGRCRFSDFKDLRAVVIDSAVTLNYEQHNGPVTGIARSHFSDQCFATVSSDGKLKLFRNADMSPIVETAPFEGEKFTCCDWSPFRPYVIIVGTSNGNLLFFDFYAKRQRTKPAKMVKIFEGAEILSVQFNNRE
ncbi:putative WD repeat-containing protein 34 [Hypsibius exemplaris]|uniref:WD repeat-containing protein 34 n=1 Tax=Hypsibius exemplaris TaxID=2072580 RepID=A0A1W0WIP5_HYPEX|nr:putative WD repeat-containing protein 34 [Hypsibius exemplaris]